MMVNPVTGWQEQNSFFSAAYVRTGMHWIEVKVVFGL